jgi:hypothetical protein
LELDRSRQEKNIQETQLNDTICSLTKHFEQLQIKLHEQGLIMRIYRCVYLLSWIDIDNRIRSCYSLVEIRSLVEYQNAMTVCHMKDNRLYMTCSLREYHG